MAVTLTGDALIPFQQFLTEYCDAYQSMDLNRSRSFPED